MEQRWIVSRRLCVEKLNVVEQDKLYEIEKKQNRMLGSNEIIKLFFGKLKWLKDKEMPINSGDLFFQEMIPCAPKVRIEKQAEAGKPIINENIGGSDIIHYFDSENVINILHIWDSQMDLAKKSLWDRAVFSKKQTEKTKADWGEIEQ